MPHSSLCALLAFDAFCLLLIALILTNVEKCLSAVRFTWRWTTTLAASENFRASTIAIAPVFLSFLYFYYCIANQQHLPKGNFIVVTMTFQAALESSLLCFLSIIGLRALGAGAWTIGAFTAICSTLIAADWLAIICGGGRFAPEMIGWVSVASTKSLMTYGLVLKVCVLLSLGIASVVAIYKRCSYKLRTTRLAAVLVFAALIVIANPARWFLRGITAFLSQTEREHWRMNIDACGSWMVDPVLRLPSAILGAISSEYALVDLNSYLAKRAAVMPSPARGPVVPEKAMQRIVFILLESFSLNFCKTYNAQLPQSITPFIDSLPSLGPVWTTSMPTTAGIATHFCSHPNAQGAIKLGYPHSVVRRLKNSGWRTVLFESADENYQQDISHFRALGFTEHYGAQWQMRNGKQEYISEWGACDRITFNSAIEYLSARSKERVFLTVLTGDTHIRKGRTRYAGLSYPEEPAWIRNDRAYLLLRSVFRMDYDLRLFVAEMNKRHLLDKDTVLIVTGDHSCPPFPELNCRLGLNRSRWEEIPWITLTEGNVPAISAKRVGSQQDTAPTIAYLGGLKPDPAWWGSGLQQTTGDNPIVSYDHGKAAILNPDEKEFHETRSRNVLELCETFVYDNDCAKARAPGSPQ